MRKSVFALVTLGFITLSSFTNTSELVNERKTKITLEIVDDVWCCTATDGLQSVTACGAYPCTRAKAALAQL